MSWRWVVSLLLVAGLAGGCSKKDEEKTAGEKLVEPGIGTRFVCPNPLAPRRYLVVQAGTDAEAVYRASNLPIFLPDYVVFDERFKSNPPRLVLGRAGALESGFFTEEWRLPGTDGPAVARQATP